MQPLKILHTADWHIGSFPCPASKDKANLRFLDICAYIEFLISEAENRKPDIIIIAGDVFHQAKTWSDRGLQETRTIIQYITDLSNIAPVCILRGTPNHDGKMHFDLLCTALGNRDNIIIVDEPCVKTVADKAAIAFVPIFDKNLYRAEATEALDKEAENNFFCDKVRDAILDLKPQADATGLPTILVTHYTVLGAALPNGQTSIFANQEVVIDPVTLIQADYWLYCLGHVHKPQRLEVCPNAFYSGSLCALNFNDENDPHGFYMHEISDKNLIKSEYIETPSRKFHTIFLNDAQLEDIISREYDLTGYADNSMRGDIVRIIYTCMDTTNKKLNKALLEKALYNFTEAFYVQEIIPAEITVTVDRTAMRNTASIADNLLSFLTNERIENNSISSGQIQDCVAIAQPLIDELTANQSVNHNVGVFTPIEIEVKNYRNYKHAIFNYDDIRFCVINGDNGAGKSSLFMDAMLDALFEETREGDITGWINNDINCRSGSIRLTFSIGDNIYKITRTRQKSGKATLNIAQMSIDENGEESWNDMSEERLRDTQEVINKIVGMDAMTLKSCGLIMQDAYGLFLQADKTTRMDILGNILNLSIYNDLCASAGEYSKLCQREITRINDEENAITANLKDGSEIQAKLNETFNNEKDYERDLKKCNSDLEDCIKQRESCVKAIETYNRYCDEIDALNMKKIQCQKAIDEQNSIITEAQTIVARKAELDSMTQRRNVLTETIKDMSAKADRIALLMTVRQGLEADIARCDGIINDADKKITAVRNEIEILKLELANTQDIENNAARYESAKAEIANIESKLKLVEAMTANLNEKKTQLAEVKHKLENHRIEYETKVSVLNKKIALLNESGCPIAATATCKFLADANAALSEKVNLDAEYAKAQEEYNSIAPGIEAEIAKIEGDIANITENLPDLDLKKRELAIYESAAFQVASIPEKQKALAAFNQQLTEFTAIKTENETKKNSIIESYNDNTAEVSSLTVETANLDALKKELENIGDLNQLRSNIAANEATIASAANRITELNNEISIIDFDIFDKVRDRSQIPIDNIKINEIDTTILACKTQQELLSKNIAENGKMMGQLQQDMDKYQNDLKQLDKLRQLKNKMSYEASNASWLKKAFDRNGIPHNIIRSIIPVLETTASNILNQMSGNTMSIALQTERTLTTKKEIATLDVIVRDTVTGDLPYLSRSGGERVKAALSVILALAEIKSSESGTQLGFLFIDEPPFLDSSGIEAYCDALVAIQNRYTNLKIMAITHDPEMKSRFSQSIDIVKTTNGSEIRADL